MVGVYGSAAFVGCNPERVLVMACNSFGGTKYNLAQIQQVLRQAGWPENLIAKAAAIVIYESNGWTKAYNGCGEDSYGWFQIYRRYHPEFEPNYTNGRIYDPLYNAQAGLQVYRVEKWNAWKNSNAKYERNLNGIAAQSQSVFNGGNSGNNVALTGNSLPITNGNGQAQTKADYGLYAAIGLVGFYLLSDY